MIYLRLFWEFFKTGLFAIGGGMATLPFLHDIGEATGWFTQAQLMNMLAVSESTPGPMGVNMATYVGFHIGSASELGALGGIVGAVVATLGLITPSIAVILIIAGFLQKFRHSRSVEAVFSGLRPASTALITAAGLSVAFSVFTVAGDLSPNSFPAISWPALLLAGAVFVGMKWTPLKKLHPIVFILASAAAGILLQL